MVLVKSGAVEGCSHTQHDRVNHPSENKQGRSPTREEEKGAPIPVIAPTPKRQRFRVPVSNIVLFDIHDFGIFVQTKYTRPSLALVVNNMNIILHIISLYAML